METEMRISKFP